MFDEIFQNREGLWSQRNRLRSSPKAFIDLVQPKWTKAYLLVLHRRIFSAYAERIATLLSVVEDNAEGVTASGPQATHTVPQVHAVNTLLALHWTMMNSKHHAVTFTQRHNQRP